MVPHPTRSAESRADSIAKLGRSLGVTPRLELLSLSRQGESREGLPTIGAEIEVHWTNLLDEIATILNGRNFREIPPSDKARIDEACSSFERDRQALYDRTVDCGIPKGKDGFHEFAFRPVHCHSTLWCEIDVLYRAGLIPSGKPNPLHITIGGLTNMVDAGIILCVLECAGGMNRDRILKGLSAPNSRLSWNRKGYNGIVKRQRYQLVGAATDGIELRTLFTSGSYQVGKLLFLAQLLAHGAIESRANRLSSCGRIWESFRNELTEQVLRPHGLNRWWGEPHQSHQDWLAFADFLETPHANHCAALGLQAARQIEDIFTAEPAPNNGLIIAS